MEEDLINQLRMDLVDQILLKLLWQDYVKYESPKYQDVLPSSTSIRSMKDNDKDLPADAQKHKCSEHYLQELGKCILEILSNISVKNQKSLVFFCTSVQEWFKEIIKSQKNSQCVDQLVNFLWSLKQLEVPTGDTWPLLLLAGPLVTCSFHLIKSHVSLCYMFHELKIWPLGIYLTETGYFKVDKLFDALLFKREYFLVHGLPGMDFMAYENCEPIIKDYMKCTYEY